MLEKNMPSHWGTILFFIEGTRPFSLTKKHKWAAGRELWLLIDFFVISRRFSSFVLFCRRYLPLVLLSLLISSFGNIQLSCLVMDAKGGDIWKPNFIDTYFPSKFVGKKRSDGQETPMSTHSWVFVNTYRRRLFLEVSWLRGELETKLSRKV